MDGGTVMETRHERIRARMREEGLDALIAFSNAKAQGCVRYLSNYFVRFVGAQTRPDGSYYTFGHTALLFPLDGEPVLLTDQPWDIGRAKEISWITETEHSSDMGAVFAGRIAEAGYERVGIDNWFIFPAVHYNALVEGAPGASFTGTMLIEDTYRVKGPDEVALIRKAEDIAVTAVMAGLDAVYVGAAEHEFALATEMALRATGDLETAASSIISGGANTGSASDLPSAEGSYVMKSGDWAMFDICPSYQGYAGDICRMVVAGSMSDLDPDLKKLYDATLAMNEAVIAMIRPGVTPLEMNQVAYEVADAHGVAKYKIPLLGHSLGLDIHDPPDYYYDGSPLEESMTITVEPCLLVPGVAGTRVEDVVLVTADGCEVLSAAAPKELRAAGS